MIDLPRHLSPWATQLALFPREMALALGAMVSRLSNVIGGGQFSRATDGAPDGYDGIASRGSYERLLAAEWLLLDEIPDEFLRRVVSGERSFLRRAHTHRAAEKRCIALFDAGSDQLGAPRLAHLAILILLARRAQLQRATIEWGVLQDPASRLHTAVTKAAVLELLRSRCVQRPSPGDLDRWLAAAAGPVSLELWVVGAEHLLAGADGHGASVVTVSDVLEPGEPQRILVRAASPRRARVRESVLELPAGRVAVKLLRDPFSEAVAPRSTTGTVVDIRSNLLFAPDGRRLYVRGANSTLVTFHVPNSPRATTGPPVTFAAPDGHTILAVGRSPIERRATVLTQHGDAVVVHVLSKRGASITRSERFVSVAGYTPGIAPAALHALTVLGRSHACFISAEGNLIELSDGKLHVRDEAAVASRGLPDCLAWASLDHGVPLIMWARTSTGGELAISRATTPPDLPCIFRCSGIA